MKLIKSASVSSLIFIAFIVFHKVITPLENGATLNPEWLRNSRLVIKLGLQVKGFIVTVVLLQSATGDD